MLTILYYIDPYYYKDIIYLDSHSKKSMYAESKKDIFGI